jgi:hypothetical protein
MHVVIVNVLTIRAEDGVRRRNASQLRFTGRTRQLDEGQSQNNRSVSLFRKFVSLEIPFCADGHTLEAATLETPECNGTAYRAGE